ncbi:MAG TPA: Gfo/Idh/MocA family oxidoreductase [Paenibacillus sp.]|nr:Gfo/Idh/MocA family oxidoreductase [Paenibacillus sp.]
MEPFTFGFIGLGKMTREHLRRLAEFPDVRIAAICDTHAAQVKEVGDRYGIDESKRYTAYEKLIQDPDVGVVVCVTPNDTHAAIIKACVDAGKPFLAEKPFTRTFDEAQELLTLIRRKPVFHMIGYSYRYHPQFAYARALIQSGKLGTIRHAFFQYLQGWGSAALDGPMSWRFDRAVSGTGALGDLGSHMIDMARFLVGEFHDVSGRLATFVRERRDPVTGGKVPVDVDDFASFQATVGQDVAAVFQTSRNAIGSENRHEVYLYGDEGTLFVTSNDRGRVFRSYFGEDRKRALEEMAVPQENGSDQWDDFLNGLRGRPTGSISTAIDGFVNQSVMEAIVRSHRERRTVELAAFPHGDRPIA